MKNKENDERKLFSFMSAISRITAEILHKAFVQLFLLKIYKIKPLSRKRTMEEFQFPLPLTIRFLD